MRTTLDMPTEAPVKLEVEVKGNRLDVHCSKTIFGAQPFLALKSFDHKMYHDNFCLGDNDQHFFYVFDFKCFMESKVSS